jgi:hypothetical protein
MRAGPPRVFWWLVLVELLVFVVVGLMEDLRIGAVYFLLLTFLSLISAGREVELTEEGILLSWGYPRLFKRWIPFGEIVDLIDVASSKYLVMARYVPEALIVPLGTILVGVVFFFYGKYPAIGLLWVVWGFSSLVGYVFSRGDRNTAIITFYAVLVPLAVVSYLKMGVDVLFPFITAGLLMGGLMWDEDLWERSMLILVTEKGVYTLNYSSRKEILPLISHLGGAGEG